MSEEAKTAPPAEEPPAPAEHPLLKRLREGLPLLQGTTLQEARGMSEILLQDSNSIFEACRFLKQSADLAFDLLLDIVGIDYWDVEPRYGVVYNLHSVSTNRRIYLKVLVSSGDAQLPTLTSLWSGANWMEREVYDMFGIRFMGHPDLRKILTPDDLEGHPLRKDFPLGNVDIWPDGANTNTAR
ncbi:MAG: NADH-quinone oxidoreductase subunit C [Armatimonadota bacterium]|nr:NADH-quinone oxidoreductase subunit C [Armatimonadota bacterium]